MRASNPAFIKNFKLNNAIFQKNLSRQKSQPISIQKIGGILNIFIPAVQCFQNFVMRPLTYNGLIVIDVTVP
jgi:hypothetical protein